MSTSSSVQDAGNAVTLPAIPYRARRRAPRPKLQRLSARLDAIEARGALYRAGRQGEAEAVPLALGRCVELARAALAGGSYQTAAFLAAQAERAEIMALPAEALPARARAQRQEATALLPAADAEAVAAVLDGLSPEASEGELRGTLIEAARLFERCQNHASLSASRVTTRLRLMGAVLFGAILGLSGLLAAFDGLLPAFLGSPRPSAEQLAAGAVLAAAMLLGTIGASLSAMLGLTRGSNPSRHEALSVTTVRPLIGAASGLIALLVAGSGAIDLGGQGFTLGLLALAMGFSERLVLGALPGQAGDNPSAPAG